MIIISNHILSQNHLPVPDHVVVRVNVAWVKTKEELEQILQEITHDIYLDYPQGRSKPPRPTLSLDEVIGFAHRFPHVRYFAVSNVENPDDIHSIKTRLPAHISVVPKIETREGIEKLEQIITKIDAEYIMLDKEDLYVDVERDSKLFEDLIELAREKTIRAGAEVLELQGVIFSVNKKYADKKKKKAEMIRKVKDKAVRK